MAAESQYSIISEGSYMSLDSVSGTSINEEKENTAVEMEKDNVEKAEEKDDDISATSSQVLTVPSPKIGEKSKLKNIKEEETLMQKANKYFHQAFQVSTKYTQASRRVFKSQVALESEKEHHEGSNIFNRYVIHPFSILRLAWDLIMIIVIFMLLIFTPLRIVYHDHNITNNSTTKAWDALCHILETIMWLDMLVNFRSGYLEEYTRKVILDSKGVVKHYAKTYFIVDLISSLPPIIELILQKSGAVDWKTTNALQYSHKAGKVYILCGAVQIFALFSFSRLFRYIKNLQVLFRVRSRVWRILNLIVVVSIACHWNSCAQYAIAAWEEFPSTSWIIKKKLHTKEIPEIYAHSIFKTFSHMLSIGYGYYAPHTTLEVLATIISMLIGAIFYAMFIANLNHLVMQADTAGNKYDEKIGEVKQFMNYHRLPKTFQQKVIQFYDTKYNQQYFDPHTMLQKVNPKIKAQIMYLICRHLVMKSSLFEDASKEFMMDFCSRLHYEIFMPEDVIITAGHKGRSMCFIEHGLVQVVEADGTVLMSMGDGTHFGEMSLIYDEVSEVSVHAIETTHTYYVLKDDFDELLELHPGVKDHMLDIITERVEANRGSAVNLGASRMSLSHIALDTDLTSAHALHGQTQRTRCEILNNIKDSEPEMQTVVG